MGTSYNTALVLQALARGHGYGFDIMRVAGLPSGAVYPLLRRLETAGHVESSWEREAEADERSTPRRRYYRLTAEGREVLDEAVERIAKQQQVFGGALGRPSKHMTTGTGRGHMGDALARLVVHAAGWSVPQGRRAVWREEWRSELWHERQRLEAGGEPGPSMLGAALGSVRDAWAVRRQTRTRGAEGGTGFPTGGGGDMARELSRAVRGMIRSPGFATLVVLTLAIGIGATTAIFSVVDAILLEPLPYPESERLVELSHPVPGLGEGTERWGLSVAGYFHFRESLSSVELSGALSGQSGNLTAGVLPERVMAALATPSLLELLGASASHGRALSEADGRPGGSPVVVLDHRFWEQRFGGDGSVIGRTVEFDGTAMEIVGVADEALALPDGFGFAGGRPDLWIPWKLDPTAPAVNSHYLRVLGRLGPGADLMAARDEMVRATARLPERFPDAYSLAFMSDFGFTADVRRLQDVVVGDIRPALWVLFGSVGLVLLIACANAANLFLVRSEERSADARLRLALGAGPLDLLRTHLTESVLLTSIAAAMGIVLAAVGLDVLVAQAPPALPRLGEIGIDGTALGVAGGLAFGTAILFGSIPVMAALRSDGLASVGEGRRTAGSRRGELARALLVAGQVALAVVVLAASGLMVRSFLSLRSLDAGFDPESVLTFHLGLPASEYETNQAIYQGHRAVLTRLGSSPAVASVGAIDALPLVGGGRCVVMYQEDRPLADDETAPCPATRFVSPGYFETMGIDVQDGRAFQVADNDVGPGAVVVSHSFAEAYWPGESPIGRGVSSFGPGSWYRVVGVVDDVRSSSLEEPAPATLYYSLAPVNDSGWFPLNGMTYVVRTQGATPTAVVDEMRRLVAEVEPDAPLAQVAPMSQWVDRAMSRTTFTVLLLGLAGTMATVLGVVGLYGLVSYSVSRRKAEIGVRLALGARVGEVTGLVLRRSMVLVAAGAAVGLVVTLAGARFLSSLLFGVSPNDPATLVAVCATMVVAALLGAYQPARRAAAVDPARSLRES